MLMCQVFCNDWKSRFPHCILYSLPSAREGPCSCLVGGPPAQQVQHAVVWSAMFTCFNALHCLVVHTQEGTKALPFCIQLVVESFKNVCRQRRGGKDVVLLCCEATAFRPQTHRLCQVVEVVEEKGGVWEQQSLVLQRVCMRGGSMALRRERRTLLASLHISHALVIARMAYTTISGGTSNVCSRGLHPHMQYTCYTSH